MNNTQNARHLCVGNYIDCFLLTFLVIICPMDILFGNNKIKKLCAKPSPKLQRRLDDIAAADHLAVLRTLPGRLHLLRGDRKGKWALDLEHPKRLVFEIANDPVPMTADGQYVEEKITAIRLLEVVDYHG